MSSNSALPTQLTSFKPMSFITGWPGIIVFGILAASMYIASFVSISNFAGSKDDWNLIKPQITKIWILTLIGTFALTIAALFYFIQDPNKVIYFILCLSCLSFGLSYSSLAIATITR